MKMNLERHIAAFRGLYEDLVNGDTEKAERGPHVLRGVLRRRRPSRGVLPGNGPRGLPGIRARAGERSNGAGGRSNPRAIRRTALLTIEGERDDICSLGQTLAAHDLRRTAALHENPLCSGRRRALRRVQRPALEQQHLSDRAGRDLRVGVIDTRRGGVR